MVKIWHKGMTLLELIIVLSVLGLLASVVSISWPGKAAIVRAEAQQLAQNLRYVRRYAVAHDALVRLNFSQASDSYQFTDDSGSNPINFPSINSATVQLDDSTSISLNNLPEDYLIFDQDGQVYTAIDQPLEQDATIVVAGSGLSATVTVKAYSGSVVSPKFS